MTRTLTGEGVHFGGKVGDACGSGQDIEHRLAGILRVNCCLFDGGLGVSTGHVAREREAGGLGESSTAVEGEVSGHRVRIGLHIGERLLQPCSAAGRTNHRLRDRDPFQHPCGGVAVLGMGHGKLGLRGQGRSVAAKGGDHFGADRVGLVGHGRGASTACQFDFGNLATRQQQDIACDTGGGTTGFGAPVGQVRRESAVGMPRRGGLQAEFGRKSLDDGRAVRGGGRVRAGGSAELDPGTGAAKRWQRVALVEQALQPVGDAQAEADRRRDLGAGAACHRGVDMGLCEICERGDQSGEACFQQVEAIAQTQQQCAVHDVMGGGPPVHPVRGVFG